MNKGILERAAFADINDYMAKALGGRPYASTLNSVYAKLEYLRGKVDTVEVIEQELGLHGMFGTINRFKDEDLNFIKIEFMDYIVAFYRLEKRYRELAKILKRYPKYSNQSINVIYKDFGDNVVRTERF